MLQPPFSHRYRCAAAALLLAAALGGCATNDPRVDRTGDDTGAASRADLQQANEQPARPALVEVEADVGFTVTEVVPITGAMRSNYRQALTLLADNDFAGGIALLLEVTAQTPDATAPFVDLGIAYGHLGDYEKAAASFDAALASTPDHPVAHNELGIVYRKLGRFVEARQSYERALEIYPGYHYARRNLAVLCDLYLVDLQCALGNYEIYAAAVPDDREVQIWIADTRNRRAGAE